jgi:hypothetical protein
MGFSICTINLTINYFLGVHDKFEGPRYPSSSPGRDLEISALEALYFAHGMYLWISCDSGYKY